ncbi:MAG TPA: tetratricopeptide repeat protein, partial [Nitrospirae bacterium]|nr:tetratricopeptide repeat protein [Nitrospirota bacterium]
MKDKTAIIKTAQKYASKGQIDKAIAEWEKLLDEAKDGNIHNTIGDLYLRKGAEREAIESFDKAAEIFRKDGFYPKAIAIYKKILNIAPNNVDALIALARLNAEKGLTGNAIENYYRAAEIYNREGLTEKATMVVEKMLHLSPADVITRSKIAYLYFRIGLRERAANEYASIGATYLEKNDYEKAEEFYNKAMEYDPDNVSALIGLSNLAGKLKNTDKAFRYLETAMSLDPDNKEVLLSYARLAIEFNKTEDAKKALIKLAEADPSDIRARKLLGTLYLDEGLLEIAWEELLPYIDDALNKQKWSEAHELLHKFKDLYPVAAKQRLLHICKAQGDDNAISHELKELAGLYKNEGSNEDALHLYKEALELNPD